MRVKRSAGVFLFWLLPLGAAAQELLTEAAVAACLTDANPYYYTAVGQQYVAASRAEAAEGAFDTRLGVTYDDKRYPASDGELADIYVEKATQSGVELLAGYRRAEGVQEYSNIKTGDEGEVRVGVKLPVFSVLGGMNERRYGLQSASLEAQRSTYVSKENLRHLSFDVFTAYYSLLFRHDAVVLEETLLSRAREREAFIRERVDAGEAPGVTLLEARRQILNREQRLAEAANACETALTSLLRYLGLSREAFDARYALPPLPEAPPRALEGEAAVRSAVENRPDIRMLAYDRRQYELADKYNDVSRYPKFNVALYGVHDFQYDNGFKVAVDMLFPIERSQYAGRKREIQNGIRAVDEQMAVRRIETETAVANRLSTMRAVRENLAKAEEEITLTEALEEAERKKYRLGAGNLVMVNLRELDTLQARMKRLDYRLRLLKLGLELDRDMGEIALETPK